MNRSFFVAYFILLFAFGVNCSAGSAAAILESPSNSSTPTPPTPDEASRLGFVKIGVALAMFLLVLVACGLPILVMTCIRRRAEKRALMLPSIPFNLPASQESSCEVESNRGAEISSRIIYDEANGSISNRSSPEQLDLQWNSNSAGPLIQPNGDVRVKSTGLRDVFRRQRNVHLWASRITCFAAGVFLSTGFMDLFPEVDEAFSAALSLLKIKVHYPLAALFTLLGFFLVLMVEQLVIVCHSRRRPYCSPPATSTTAAVDVGNEEVGFEQPAASGGHSHLPAAEVNGSIMRVLLLLIALSVHSVFEGLAVGLQRSISEVLALFTALLLHKLIMAASIGISLATSHQAHQARRCSNQGRKTMKTQVVGTIIFALASPIGVMIGWALVAQRSSAALLVVIAVLQGLACGTFFFVVFCEMLPHEFKEGSMDRIMKFCSLVLGFMLVAIYMIFEDE